jgi:hypothetical protein
MSVLDESTDEFFEKLPQIIHDRYGNEHTSTGDLHLVRHEDLDMESAIFMLSWGPHVYVITSSDRIQDVPTDPDFLMSWVKGGIRREDIKNLDSQGKGLDMPFDDSIGYFSIFKLADGFDYHSR